MTTSYYSVKIQTPLTTQPLKKPLPPLPLLKMMWVGQLILYACTCVKWERSSS
jgi:hypothetical protein